MNYPSYSFYQTEEATQFFFESTGPKGVIQKVVLFTPTESHDLFNMALVDYDSTTGTLDDKSVSDNGDTAKILATIFQIVRHYLMNHPTHIIYFEGNTPTRNRLYRMAISQAIEELSLYFAIFGLIDYRWETFTPNRSYKAYLIRTS